MSRGRGSHGVPAEINILPRTGTMPGKVVRVDVKGRIYQIFLRNERSIRLSMNLLRSSLYRIMSERTCSAENSRSVLARRDTPAPHFSLTSRPVLPSVRHRRYGFKCDTRDTAGTTRKRTSGCTRRPCDSTAKRQ